MENSPDLEPRVAALEIRVDATVADAAARHLAAAVDRDLSAVVGKLDANRVAINALGVQTAGRFDEVDRRFDLVDRRFEAIERRLDSHEVGFAQMRAGFDAQSAGMAHLAEMRPC